MKRWTIHLEVNTNSEEREPPTSNPKLLDLGANFEINNRIFSFELDVHLLKFRGTNGGFILWSRELLDPSQRFAQKELNLPEMKYQDEDLARFISYFTLCATRCHLKTKKLVNNELDKAENKCGCIFFTNENGQIEKRCGIQYSTLDQVGTCPIPSLPERPVLLQVPAPEYRTVRADFIQFTGLPDDSCRRTGSCLATILFIGNNRSLGLTLVGNMFLSSSSLNSSNILGNLSNFVLGSESMLLILLSSRILPYISY